MSWEELCKDDAYVKQEIVNAWDWMGSRHSNKEWEQFCFGLGLMYFHCNQDMQITVQAALDQAVRRKTLLDISGAFDGSN